MKKNRYDVEYDVNMVVEDLREEYDLENDFYGDCYPQEVFQLENKMEKCTNIEDYQELLNEVKEIFESYI